MLKWFRRIIVFLLLGAIVNVAVAWSCALSCQDVRLDDLSGKRVSGGETYLIWATSRFGYQYIVDYHIKVEYAASILDGAETYPGRKWWPGEPQQPLDGIGHIGCGWPMLALSATLVSRSGIPLVTNAPVELIGGIAVNPERIARPREWDAVPKIIPYHPLWDGIAINTMIYSTLTALVVYGCRATTTVIRCRRGLCPACAYPRGTSPVCTECGEALPGVAAK